MTADFFERAQDLDMRLLRYFALVATEGGMRRAAERLFLPPPPLRRQIRKFEDALGVSPLTRHSKGMEPTPDARQVLEAILPLLRLPDATRATRYRLGKTEWRLLRARLTTAL